MQYFKKLIGDRIYLSPKDVSNEEIFLKGKYYDKLHMDILENEFDGEYIRNKNIK